MLEKTLLVTGGAGFIGSHFVKHMMETYPDYRIVVLDSLTYAGSVDNLPSFDPADKDSRLQFILGDVCNELLVVKLVQEADWVVHLAAETNVTRSIYDTLPFIHTDIIGTQTICTAVLDAGDRVERFLYISTSEVYGTADTDLMDEEHSLNPSNPYAAAKCGADRLVYAHGKTYELPVVIVRPFNNYGDRQHLEKVLPRFITSAILGENLRVHGDGSAARDFMHVSDMCRALDLILQAPVDKVTGEVFNVASGTHRTVTEIAREVCERMDYPRDSIQPISDRPGQVLRHTGDWSKINRVLGWEPLKSWDEGLNEAIAWYRENRDWWQSQLWMRTLPIRTASGRIEYH